jgi:hypothetical protein
MRSASMEAEGSAATAAEQPTRMMSGNRLLVLDTDVMRE